MSRLASQVLKLTTSNATSVSMPVVGLGTWQAKPNEVGQAVATALDSGYRHLDCAWIYENESEIGQVLHSYFNDPSKNLKREDVFIVTKLWNTFHHPTRVEQACNESLRDLQLDYIDLYLMHWPVAFAHLLQKNGKVLQTPRDENGNCILEPVKIIDTWKAMESLVDQGKVKAIGVSNFAVHHLKALLKEARIKPAVNQVELHPYLPQKELVQYCKENGIVLTAYSPLGSTRKSLLRDATVQQVAQDESLTPAQVLISWAVQRGTTVIPKSANPQRIAENIQIKTLSEKSMTALDGLGGASTRFIDPEQFWRLNVFKPSTLPSF